MPDKPPSIAPARIVIDGDATLVDLEDGQMSDNEDGHVSQKNKIT